MKGSGFYRRGVIIKLKVSVAIFLIVASGAAYYFLVYAPAHYFPPEVAYVLPSSVTVVDTPAEIRLEIAQVKNSDQVQVLDRTHNWAHVRLADGKTGWLELKDLLESETYERGQQVLRDMGKIPVQAAGHTTGEINLHLEPSRAAPELALLEPNEHVEIFGRRWAERTPRDSQAPASAERNDEPAPGSPFRDAWYLVRAGSHGGWVLGRFITLDVPADISVFAEGVNTVAWVVLDTVNDNGRKVPQYLVADRMGTQEFDFTHIRVFTWWSKNQRYVTAYVESNVNGYFPIRVSWVDDKPQFRLRLVDKSGRKFQKVYGMSSTIVRPLGRVEGWESDAMPTRPVTRSRRRR
jgi:SH3-like domain-containing protein